MQSEKKIKFLDRLSLLRETQFGAFLPVLFALTAIWGYFGLILPIHDLISGEAENFRAIFLSPRNIYNLFMQSAVIAALAVGITVVLLLGEIDLSAAATAGVCAALLGVLVLAGVPGFIACLIVIFVGTYVRTKSVNTTIASDWFTFLIALMFSNFLFFSLLNNFSELTFPLSKIGYNTFFTLFTFPIFWFLFSLYKINFMGVKDA